MPAGALERARILIVDDEAANVQLLDRLVRRGGYDNVLGVTDPRQAPSQYLEYQPDLVLLDLLMPHLDGFAVMEWLRQRIPPEAYLPILVLTADVSAETRRRALAAGANDFVTKPFDATEVLLRIKNLLETRMLALELQRQNDRLEEEVRDRTARLVQAERVAAMGSLLAGVAHELNNPLSVVLGRTAILRQILGDGPIAIQAEKIADAAERCARIVRTFLTLARHRPAERESVALNCIVQDAVELVAYPLRLDNVDVELDLAPDLPTLWADPHQLHQVMVNLITNAHHAVRESSGERRLTVTTRTDGNRRRVLLDVSDTGPGICPEIQERLFEPFFTTKPVGQGTGLGLSLCRGIVAGHAGTIQVESEPGQGAVFRIELPVTCRVEAPATRVARPPAPVGGRAILVVDDESEVAATLADLLHLDAHRVDIAANGIAALGKVEDADYDVIMSDIKMPELDGPGFYRAVEQRHPRLLRRFVFVTGDTLGGETEEFLERTGAPTLGKPFSLEEIRRAVQRVLGVP